MLITPAFLYLNYLSKRGWAALIQWINGDEVRETMIKGGEIATTNNIMELTAATQALIHIIEDGPVKEKIHITTDSEYLRKGITEWIFNWKKNGWKTANKKPVKNVFEWKSLDILRQNLNIEWHWVKAHNGHAENELVDRTAKSECHVHKKKKQETLLDIGIAIVCQDPIKPKAITTVATEEKKRSQTR